MSLRKAGVCSALGPEDRASARRIRTGWLPTVKEPMKNRVIRVSDAVWEAALRKADEKGDTVSEAVRKFLERYSR